jgi:hypothetical protein
MIGYLHSPQSLRKLIVHPLIYSFISKKDTTTSWGWSKRVKVWIKVCNIHFGLIIKQQRRYPGHGFLLLKDSDEICFDFGIRPTWASHSQAYRVGSSVSISVRRVLFCTCCSVTKIP